MKKLTLLILALLISMNSFSSERSFKISENIKSEVQKLLIKSQSLGKYKL